MCGKSCKKRCLRLQIELLEILMNCLKCRFSIGCPTWCCAHIVILLLISNNKSNPYSIHVLSDWTDSKQLQMHPKHLPHRWCLQQAWADTCRLSTGTEAHQLLSMNYPMNFLFYYDQHPVMQHTSQMSSRKSLNGVEPIHLVGILTLKMYPWLYRRFFHTVNLWQKDFFGPQHIHQHCDYMVWPLWKLASKPGALPGGLSWAREWSWGGCP